MLPNKDCAPELGFPSPSQDMLPEPIRESKHFIRMVVNISQHIKECLEERESLPRSPCAHGKTPSQKIQDPSSPTFESRPLSLLLMSRFHSHDWPRAETTLGLQNIQVRHDLKHGLGGGLGIERRSGGLLWKMGIRDVMPKP
uniref:Uncharacterized protein n=1 Tax=Corethron hystrix TaxID=216773 RepID=A0A7S1BR37_9STRA|mmetsp:Transcript_37934/g.88268  ORF Transcript_37934/g.88268 Transcript_37934/m.88268 type:complete len:142 (+) Transcript_37934:793-1218(+)